MRRAYPATGVVVLGRYDDLEFALALLEDGSCGRAYPLRERMADPAVLVEAVREVARGGA